MSYTLIKLLPAGTFTTGGGADWRAQFAAAVIVAPLATMVGEVVVAGSSTTYGVYAGYAFEAKNPFDQTICIPEASGGAPVQVYLNGVLVSEVTTPGTVLCSVKRGVNVFETVRSQSPLVVMPAGPFIDSGGTKGGWVSLYPRGADPFTSPIAPTAIPATP
jgi:hypothetical protein